MMPFTGFLPKEGLERLIWASDIFLSPSHQTLGVAIPEDATGKSLNSGSRYGTGDGMNCPRCGRSTPHGSLLCQYCGNRLASGQSANKVTVWCKKCGKRLPMMDSLLNKRQTCDECDIRYAGELAEAKDREERRKSLEVSRVIARNPELREKVMARLGIGRFEGRFFVDYGVFEEICSWDRCVTHAKNLEDARRFEDAARQYEGIGLWKEAGRVRERRSSRTVKHVSVDLNDLIEKLRDGGLAIPYKCKGCGATLTVDGSATAGRLQKCGYCGSTTDTDTLTEILQKALS